MADNEKFKDVLNIAKKAFKRLHKEGKYNPKDLGKISEYKDLINATTEVLQSAIDHEVPQELKDYLDKDAFVFSGLKVHAQLTEARSYLKNEKGEVRPYYEFEQHILKLNSTYNTNYLEAEYLFATQSAQSATNWSGYSDDTERYYLEYRTAGDDRVRDSHAALNGIVLPKDDPFWHYFYPPNGWRCRCHVVEVLASKNEKSNSKTAIAQGEKATTTIGKNGNNTLEMFRFNPGIDKKLMPPSNSYTKVVGAKEAIQSINNSK